MWLDRTNFGLWAAVALVLVDRCCEISAQRYGYGESGAALHWNEISPTPAWGAYPVKPVAGLSLEDLHRRGVKMLRIRLRGVKMPESVANLNLVGDVVTEAVLALALSIEETSRSEASSAWHHSERDPCDEINSLLKSCLDSSQTEGIPNSSRCYWAPTPEEAVACWCRVCDFQRAVEICSVPRTYQTCDACQMGRSLQDWTQSRCSVGGALTVRANTLKGRNGVIEERWHADVREVAQARLDAQAVAQLARSSYYYVCSTTGAGYPL